jgi:hypothetical protein
MKKLLFFAALAVLVITSTSAQVSFGAKAGANFASLSGDGADGVDGRTSFHIGGVVNIGVSELFSVQPELVYSAQGWTEDSPFGEVVGKLDYINIPIMADFTLAEGFSLQGGPQFGINVTSEVELDGETADIEDVESLDMGVGIGAQYRMTDLGLFFQARYMIGINDVVEDAEVKNSVISLSVGWFFN